MKILLIGTSGCFGTEFRNVVKSSNIKLKYYSSKKLDILNFNFFRKKIKRLKKPNILINSSALVGINQCEINYENAFSIEFSWST